MNTQSQIEQKLAAALNPSHLEVHNESHMHSVPANSETHFKVVIVSEQFSETRKVKRHQTVYSLLSDELAGGVHALALHTYTPEEWGERVSAPQSPNCMGGSKRD
ncbi:BolA/IbaG family iron-sulfur metabolism protein [Porticoccaceae bacterium LTM1]|nr:BolA/IbaG family iron-sulfur metabolism protein [Porticoccaceae bacterium LTM1]